MITVNRGGYQNLRRQARHSARFGMGGLLAVCAALNLGSTHPAAAGDAPVGPVGTSASGSGTTLHAAGRAAHPVWRNASSVNSSSAEGQAIVLENSFQGTTAWKPDPSRYKNSSADARGVVALRGFASATSVNRGESLVFYVTSMSTKNAASREPAYSMEIYRLGYYGGTGGRSMQKVSGLSGTRQPPCTFSAAPPSGSGVVECNWKPSFSLNVPQSWTSGVYVAQLINSEGYESYIPFVVRDDAATADFLYQQSVLTYQAYNNYGERSLYSCETRDCPNSGKGKSHATAVSFDRPYADAWGAGQLFYADFSEQKFIFRLEQMGYNVTYSTDVDTHSNGARLLAVRGVLAVGHDEYWSREMYDAMQAGRDQGVHIAFFGGNDGYWQVRLAPSTAGRANRIVVCYKDLPDPIPDPAFRTGRWRDVGRPEQTLIGVQWGNGMDYKPGPDGTYAPGTGFPLVVADAEHWIYAGTAVRNGQSVADVVGQEWDTFNDGTPPPPNTEYHILGHSVLTYDPRGVPGSTTIYPPPSWPATVDMSLYTANSGALVFGAGTIIWGHAMDESLIVRQMTRNLLDMFLATTPVRGDIALMQVLLSNSVLLDD